MAVRPRPGPIDRLLTAGQPLTRDTHAMLGWVYAAVLAPLGWWIISQVASVARTRIERNEELAANTMRWLEDLEQIGPLEIRSMGRSWHPDGIIVDLGEHGLLRARCYWPGPLAPTRLISAHFEPEVGWGLTVESSTGDPVIVWAWSVHRIPAATAVG